MITIIDYGVGNLRSVQKAFECQGHQTVITRDADALTRADHLVLPGVGAFGAGMRNLAEFGLIEPIRSYLRSERPFLGICLGLHLLFEESDETFGVMEPVKGLGFFPGRIRRFPAAVKTPEIGWNCLQNVRSVPLLNGVSAGDYFYFVHSYYAAPTDNLSLAETEYGLVYPAIVGRGVVAAIQFHPEKSSRLGLQILDNFARL